MKDLVFPISFCIVCSGSGSRPVALQSVLHSIICCLLPPELISNLHSATKLANYTGNILC